MTTDEYIHIYHLYLCRNRNRDGMTNQKEFGVATIVYSGTLRKNKKKNKTRSTKNQILGLGVGCAWGNYLEKYLKNDLIFLIILKTFLFKFLVLF